MAQACFEYYASCTQGERLTTTRSSRWPHSDGREGRVEITIRRTPQISSNPFRARVVSTTVSLQRLLWIYCPGHAGVSGNERADRLASTADITSGLQLGRAEVLRGLRNFLSTDKPEHHSIDRLKERGVEKGSGRHSTLQDRERSVFNQTNIGTVSRATLGRLLRDGAERVWAFPSATMPS